MTSTVLVTGASIGIGAALSTSFAEAGHHVVITDVLTAEGIELSERILEAGFSAEFQFMDVTSSEEVDAVVSDVVARRGSLHTVVANAGIAKKVPIGEMSDEDWHLTLDVDLYGVMRVFRAASASMRVNRAGNLIAMSSIMGLNYGWDEHANYSAAKSGVVGLVRALAVELARDGIRVNGIAPGYIRTAQSLSTENSLGAAGLEAATAYIPIGRIGEPSDVADVALFLASEQSRYITGQIITVDGGLQVGRY